MQLHWGTPIWQLNISNQEGMDHLISESYKSQEAGNGRMKSNAGNSWHSELNFAGLIQDLPIGADIFNAFSFCTKEYGYELKAAQLKYWTIITSKYGYNRRHNHPGSLLSGVLYMRVPEKSGKIMFTDPRPCKAMEPQIGRMSQDPSTRLIFDPKPGLLLVFPSFLEHEVDMTMSNEDRIISSFNLTPVRIQK